MEVQFKQADSHNYVKGRKSEIKYIAIHYTANNGDTAKNNVDYFSREVPPHTSAHYFVDENEIWQSVKDEDTAQAVGTSSPKIPCYNNNSISIEMCNSLNSVPEAVKKNTIWLTAKLMKEYNVDIDHVVRHYDVSGKYCPRPWVYDESLWTEFKNELQEYMEDNNMTQEKFNEMMNNYLKELNTREASDWGEEWQEALKWNEEHKLIQGNELGQEMYQAFLTRQMALMMAYRASKE